MSVFIWWFIIFCILSNKEEKEESQTRSRYRYDEEYPGNEEFY
jgi:hypothetical protein